MATEDAKAPKKGGMKKGGMKVTSAPAFDVAEDATSPTAAGAAEASAAAPAAATDAAAAPAAGAGAAPPKKKLSQMFGNKSGEAKSAPPDAATFLATFNASIPEKRRADFKEWKVVQAAITKPAEVGGGGARGRVNAKLSRMSTSKIHKFKPVVTLDQALEWLAGFGHADSSLVFDNQCMLVIEKGVFKEFEDLRESGGGGGAADDDDDSKTSDVRPQDSDSGED